MVNKDSHYGTPYSYNCLKLLSQNGALVTWEIHQVLAVLIIIGYDGMVKYYERTTVSRLING